MKLFLSFSVLFVSMAILNAEEPAQPESPKVPTFKVGDKVYLSVNGNVPRMVIYQSPVGKDEFNSKGFSDLDDYLVPYDSGIIIKVFSNKQAELRMNAKELLDNLQKKIIANPNDKTKWKAEGRTEEMGAVTFLFVGIQGFYELQSIKIPDGSKHRKHPQYGNGHAPCLRLRIDKDGTYQGYIQTKNKAWSTDFPPGKDNRIEVRVGTDERFTFRLRDWNTNMYEHPITDFLEITPADFEKGSITEKLDDFVGLKDAIELKFRPIIKP